MPAPPDGTPPLPWDRDGGTLPELGEGPIPAEFHGELLRAIRHHIRGMETVIGTTYEIATAVAAQQRAIDQDYWGPRLSDPGAEGWRQRMEVAVTSMRVTLEDNTARLRGMRLLGVSALGLVPLAVFIIDRVVPK